MRCFALCFISATGALVLGCHSEEPRSPDVGLTKPVNPPQPPDLGRGASRSDTEVSYRIELGESVSVCAGPVPYYDTAHAKAKAQSEATMQNLAACMLDGPLKGKSIILVGHTDPRGTEQYNDKLGQKRADDIRDYLVHQGISSDRIKSETAGKEDSSADPNRWKTDRHVEIILDPNK